MNRELQEAIARQTPSTVPSSLVIPHDYECVVCGARFIDAHWILFQKYLHQYPRHCGVTAKWLGRHWEEAGNR